MKHCIKTLSFFIILLISLSSKAQVDTLFWFAAPEVSHSISAGVLDRPIYLRLTTYAQPATVTISQPAAGGMPTQTVTIAANSTQSVDLTPWIDFIECKPANTILNYGIKITSTAQISAYYDVVSGGGLNAKNNPEAFGLKGMNGLGTDFLIPSQNYLSNDANVAYSPTPYNSFDIVATENNTTVTITPSANIVGHTAGSTFSIVLNAGQTWSGTATSYLATQHLHGSRVSADKPIAVTIKDDLLVGAPYGGCADLAGDQIVPVNLLGTEYIAMRGRLPSPFDQVFITASQNGTTITHNGVIVATINAGATYQLQVATPSSYIQTNHPVSVWQLSGIGCEVGACQLPQIECTGSSSVSYTRATDADLYFNLLVRNGGQGSFLVNGVAGVITAGQFNAVPNTSGNWYTAQINLPLASYPQGTVINIANSSLFHLGVLEGSERGGTSYGYFSNFSLVNADATASTHRVCADDTIRLFANSIQGARYQWTGPGGFNSNQQNPIIPNASTSASGVYTLTVSLTACGSGTDTVHVTVYDYPNPDLGADIDLCVDSVTLKSTSSSSIATSYLWSTGSVADSLNVKQSGTYWLRMSNNGCEAADTIHVNLNGTLNVNLGSDTSICDYDLPYKLGSVQPIGARYVWSNGWGLSEIEITRSGVYWLEVSYNGCIASDTVEVTIIPQPAVNLGADKTICASVPVRIGSEIAVASYLWNTGATTSHIFVDQTGDYWLEADVEGCKGSDTTYILAMPDPAVDLGSNRYICTEQEIVLDAGNPGHTYLWSTGSTDKTLEVSAAGLYYVTVVSPDKCVGRDSILITYLPEPIVYLGVDTLVCEETPLLLTAVAYNTDSLFWSTGASTKTISVTEGGTYILFAENECGVVSDTVQVRQVFCDIWVPNAFSPNGDGVNDIFRVLGNLGRVDFFGLSVFDRWGQRIYFTSDKYQGWDGMFSGLPCMVGTYVYMLEYHVEGKPYMEKGSFHLIR